MIRSGILLVVRSPFYGVIDFSGCGLLRRLCGILFHFSFRHEEDGAIFDAMVDFTAMIHAVRRFECVRASVVASAMIWCSASLAALYKSLVESSWISFLQRCSKKILPFSGGPQPSEAMLCTGLG
jgi:hypothetical protein